MFGVLQDRYHPQDQGVKIWDPASPSAMCPWRQGSRQLLTPTPGPADLGLAHPPSWSRTGFLSPGLPPGTRCGGTKVQSSQSLMAGPGPTKGRPGSSIPFHVSLQCFPHFFQQMFNESELGPRDRCEMAGFLSSQDVDMPLS